MGHARCYHYYHVVWSPKYRLPLLLPALEATVFLWIKEAFEAYGCEVISINGIPDHLHIIVKIPGKLCVSVVYGHVKSRVSNLVNVEGLLPVRFAWQTGFSSDTVSRRNLANAIRYVERQKIHHQTVTFEDEYVKLFLEQGTLLDPWTKGWERIPAEVQLLIDRGIHPIGLHKTQVNNILEITADSGAVDCNRGKYERLPETITQWLLP